MYDELRDHFHMSLSDIWFIRDFMRRTGFIDEVDEMGWGYGYDHNGMGELEDHQVQTIMAILAPELEPEVMLPDYETGEWTNFRSGLPLTGDEISDIQDSNMLSIYLQGDPEEFRKWVHFILWLSPTTNVIYDAESGDACEGLFWLVNLEEVSSLEAWDVLLKAWEVMSFYDNVADAPNWRILRGGDFASDFTDKSSAA
jgi:hypothetical protein